MRFILTAVVLAETARGSHPDSCYQFDRYNAELERLNALRSEYEFLARQRMKDVGAMQVRIDGLRSAMPLLPKGKAPMWNEDFRLVADWFETTLEHILRSDSQTIGRAIASFVDSQDMAFKPSLGILLSEIIAENEKELATLSGMAKLHKESEQMYASRIALIAPTRRYLLSLCLREMDAVIRELELEGPTRSMVALQPLRAQWHRYLTLSIHS